MLTENGKKRLDERTLSIFFKVFRPFVKITINNHIVYIVYIYSLYLYNLYFEYNIGHKVFKIYTKNDLKNKE